MTAVELLEYISNRAEKVNGVSNGTGARLPFDVGFAIPIPEDTREEDMAIVDKELITLMWRFERVSIRKQQFYVLFPFG